MSQPADFQKLRKRRRRTILLWRVMIIAAIVFAGYMVLAINNVLVHRQFPTLAVNFIQGFGGPGFPVRAPGGILRDVKALGNDIVVLNDSNLHIFNRTGRQMLGVQHISDGTIVLTSGNRMLTYAGGTTGFNLYFQNRLILEGNHDSPIISAALGERGNYALVSSTMQFRSHVMVFSAQFEEQFEWGSPSELVAMVALSPAGTAMAAGSIGAYGGELFSSVLFFAFDRPAIVARQELPGELILSMEYLSNTSVGVITDKGLRIIDTQTGRITGRYDIPGGRLAMSRISGGYILLLNENPQYRTQTVLLFNARAQELGRTEPEMAVRDMQVGGRGVYILSAVGISHYDHAMNRVSETDKRGALRILLTANALYYLTDTEVRVLSRDLQAAQATE